MVRVIERFLPYRIMRIAAKLSGSFSIVRADYDLSRTEWIVLATLRQFKEMTAKDIGTHSFQHKTKISRAVSVLEKRRWLKRTERENNRREELLSLTKLGEQTCEEITLKYEALDLKIAERLTPEGRNNVLRAMDDLERLLNIK